MSRPLRIEFSNAWYHVMNRGRWREDVFYTDIDRQVFLSLLEEISERFSVQIHAYCLMDNHYHLLLNTPLPNLQRAMRHLGGVYTQIFNRMHSKEGALFRGRYKSILVDSDEYLTQLSRYIHLNPVDAGLVNLPDDYKWSSYQAFLQLTQKPKWLFCDETLAYFGADDDRSRIDNYRDYINDGIDEEFLRKIASPKNPAIFGSDEFIHNMAFKINQDNTPEVPDQKPILHLLQPSLSTIQKCVSAYYHVSEEEIKKSKQNLGNIPRKVAIYLACRYAGLSHQLIANFFGTTSRYGVAKIFKELHREQKINVKLAEEILKIEGALQND